MNCFLHSLLVAGALFCASSPAFSVGYPEKPSSLKARSSHCNPELTYTLTYPTLTEVVTVNLPEQPSVNINSGILYFHSDFYAIDVNFLTPAVPTRIVDVATYFTNLLLQANEGAVKLLKSKTSTWNGLYPCVELKAVDLELNKYVKALAIVTATNVYGFVYLYPTDCKDHSDEFFESITITSTL
jgi:hypothetical protein